MFVIPNIYKELYLKMAVFLAFLPAYRPAKTLTVRRMAGYRLRKLNDPSSISPSIALSSPSGGGIYRIVITINLQETGDRRQRSDGNVAPTFFVIPAKAGIQECGGWHSCLFLGLRGNGSLQQNHVFFRG
jgi:hypothetical protein